jgi:hypothetical protein
VLPNVARTNDGGETWELVTPFPFGNVFGLSYVSKAGLPAVVAVARGGVAWSPDEGDTSNPRISARDRAKSPNRPETLQKAAG